MEEKYQNHPDIFGRSIEMTFGKPILYISGDRLKSDIKAASIDLKEKGVDIKGGVFKGGSFTLSGDFVVENPEELEKLIFDAMYGKKVDALVSKLNGEWRDKFYKA